MPTKDEVFNKNTNQAPANMHDTKYDNDASGWVRGAKGEPTCKNEDATGKPGFDKGNAWRRGRGL